MARQYLCGFEVKDNQVIGQGAESLLTGSGGSAAYDLSLQRSGLSCLKITAGAIATYGTLVQAPGTLSYIRMYIRVTAFPASVTKVLAGDTGVGQVNLRMGPSGTISLFVDTTLIGTSTTAIQNDGQYWRVEWRLAAGSSVAVLRINGKDEVTGSPSGWVFSNRFGCTDNAADTYTVYYDDIVYDDTAFPGEGNIVILLPTSDNARATLWTGGVGGTTNLFDAVNNTPPIGTATETNLTQIEHAGGAAGVTDSYDANMTTYTAAGVPFGAAVVAVMPLITHGEDIATGTKVLSVEVVSNPAIAISTTFAAGNDAGALGTYDTAWVTKIHTISQNPTVTLGTAPVMRVRRPETASRVASVCFMAMMVEYRPGALLGGRPGGTTGQSQMTQLLGY